ncbi:hypothetical protein AB0N16_26405 [Streptomyces sp. NPDC051105]|uniref:hypothetical protein n=1 Tax=Streptomyces sp. NPDC051105 TaxID=3154843 RepID=UPI00341282D8
MTAGQTAGDDRHDGDDALLAVLMDAEPSDAQRADPAFMAEYRAATADTEILRERLGLIGDALAGPRPAARPAARPRPRPRRHPRLRALGIAGALAAAFASVVLGFGWLAAHGPSGAGSDSSAGEKAADSASGAKPTTGPGYLACARLVAEGTVTGVRQLPDTGTERVTLRVTHAYKPAKTAGEVDVVVASDARISAGARLLVGVTRGRTVADLYAVGEAGIARERAWIVRDLPGSRTTTCPGT